VSRRHPAGSRTATITECLACQEACGGGTPELFDLSEEDDQVLLSSLRGRPADAHG
jgi:hypothetical protein